MSTNEPTPTTPKTLDEALASIDTLQRSLKSARDDEKRAREKFREFAQRIAEPLGVASIEDREALAAQAAARLGEVEKVVGERTSTIAKERDEAKAKAAEVESRWTTERVENALRAAFAKSGADARHERDFIDLYRGVFVVDANGEVRTKADTPNVIPNVDPAQFVHGVVKSQRGHWWPNSVGGGARGSAVQLNAGAPDCFKPGPTWNVTQQAHFESQHGSAAALAAAARWGTRPFWMGGRG